ncbi:MAG: hydantoinase/oxoprolinase family protein [Desulfobacterales bacterium]|nr:hydantoinase/oxoprolinase family protein [Desulfobacterales bacterium]
MDVPTRESSKRGFYLGVDIGGTFTDAILIDEEGRVYHFKTPSVPSDPSEGFMQCLFKAGRQLGLSLEELLNKISKLSYGNTIATNALLENKVARTGLVTTRGFRDVLAIARIGREYLGIDLQCQRPAPLVPRSRIEEITERVDRHGEVVIALREEEIDKILDKFSAAGIEAAAVCLLWSFKNAAHEKKIAAAIRERFPGMYCSLSHEIAPVIGEYERTATTVINASLGPLLGSHLGTLSRELAKAGLQVPLLLMQASGGVVPTADAVVKPITLVNSGPAGGVIAGKYLSQLLDLPNCICMDMGGTSLDVSLVTQGEYSASLAARISDNNVVVPMLDIYCIGAGGGSIAWLEGSSRLKVGPQSAGSNPGPSCYDRGGQEPTVTDADVVLGRIDPQYFLGGEILLDRNRAAQAIEEKIAGPLGLDLPAAAEGICCIVDANMAEAVRTMTLRKGYDPVDYALIAFGGAGPVHACAIAEELGIKTIVIPSMAAVQSAFGIVQSDIVHSLTLGDTIEVDDLEKIGRHFAQLEEKGFDLLQNDGIEDAKMEMRRWLDIHYRGQAHEVTVPVASRPENRRDIAEIIRTFEAMYESIYGKGTGFSQAGYEIAMFRVDAVGKTKKPATLVRPFAGADPGPALKGRREVFFQGSLARVPVYSGEKLQTGNTLDGPCIVEYMDTTAVIHAAMKGVIDPYLNLILQWKDKSEPEQ